jgi:hypothetical protein
MLDFFESEKAYFKQQEQIEKDNIDKLRIFLVSDQTEIKNNIQYFSDVNETLLTHIKSIEKKHIEQQLCHENVRKEYALKQLGVFQKLKQNIISLTETHLNEIVDYYNQIDSLNQFLDTAEPLKEIRINELKKELEIKELNQRIAFKIGKQSRDIQLIENQKEFDNQMAKLERDKKHAELEKDIELAKLAKQKDEELSNATLKFNIAKEEYDMRVKNRALERAVLDSQFSFQTKMYDVQKDIAKQKVYRQYDLREKELEYDINIITNEENYQVEVLERDLEDQTLKLDEKITKIRNQINAYKVKVDTLINKKKLDIKHQKEAVKAKYQRQIEQVDSALKREIKDPKNRLFESRELVESRLDQYNTYNIQFVDFMEHLIETHKYSDELDKCRDKVLKDTTFKTYVHTYLENVYSILETALKFMHKIDLRRFESQLSNVTDASSIKKLDRQKSKAIQKYETRLKRLERDLNDRQVVIDTLIQSEYDTFKKASIPNMERFDDLLTIFYNKIFDRLRTTQSQLLEETKVIYHPLTKPDEDIIAYAESSAKVAKEKITNELSQTLNPLDDELDAFINAKQDAQNEELAPLEQEKELLENNLHQIKTTIQKKIHDIHTASAEQLKTKKEALNQLHKQAEEDIVSELKEIDRHIDEMTSTYQENIHKLEQKDQEAKTILDYEERILKMALEAAEYRFKDSTEKAENVYLAAVQRLDQKAIHITEDKTETDRAIEQTLKDLYSQQDSFANKNDIKDQIQMVKQEINVDISNKRLERDDLEQKIQDIITSSETVLFASLDEAKQTIELNLEMYFNECQANSSQATDLNEEDHAVMMKHYQAVKDALYVMKETKHKDTLSQLEKTNQKIFGKGA